MDKLWAPWRNKYVTLKVKQGCIFCRNPKCKSLKKGYVICKTKYSFSMLNIFPYNNGHVMVAPLRHVKRLDRLSKQERLDLFELLIKTVSSLGKVLKPHGYNIGINIGETAGAGFKNHLHIHVVPRWQGDANFMPVVSDSKVIPESLDALYTRLLNVKSERTRKS